MAIIIELIMKDFVECSQELESLIGIDISNQLSVTQRYSSESEKEAAAEKIREVKKRLDNLKDQLDAGFLY